MATTVFQPYIDKENTGAIGAALKGRSTTLSGHVGKTFQSSKNQSLATPRQALKDVNRDIGQHVKSSGLKQQLSLKPQQVSEMKKPGLHQRRSVQPLGSRSGNIQQVNPGKKQKISVDPQFSKPVVVKKEADVEDIEHMSVYKEEEDDFEDIWPKKDRISTYMHKLISWRPPCLFGSHPESDGDSEPEDESRIIKLMEELDAMPKPTGLIEEPELLDPEGLWEPEPLDDVSLPDLDDLPLPSFNGMDSSTPFQSLDNTADTLPLVDNSEDPLPSLDDTTDILSNIGTLQIHGGD